MYIYRETGAMHKTVNCHVSMILQIPFDIYNYHGRLATPPVHVQDIYYIDMKCQGQMQCNNMDTHIVCFLDKY